MRRTARRIASAASIEEIVPNRKLVYTWAWESTPERESLVTVEFKPSGDGTELVLTHQRFADSQARDRHQHGWNGCLDRSAFISLPFTLTVRHSGE